MGNARNKKKTKGKRAYRRFVGYVYMEAPSRLRQRQEAYARRVQAAQERLQMLAERFGPRKEIQQRYNLRQRIRGGVSQPTVGSSAKGEEPSRFSKTSMDMGINEQPENVRMKDDEPVPDEGEERQEFEQAVNVRDPSLSTVQNKTLSNTPETAYFEALDEELSFPIDKSLKEEDLRHYDLKGLDYVRCKPLTLHSLIRSDDAVKIAKLKQQGHDRWNNFIGEPRRYVARVARRAASCVEQFEKLKLQIRGRGATTRTIVSWAEKQSFKQGQMLDKNLGDQRKFQEARRKERARILHDHGVELGGNLLGEGGYARVYKFKYTHDVHARLGSSRLRNQLGKKSGVYFDHPPVGSECALKIGVAMLNNPEKAWLRHLLKDKNGGGAVGHQHIVKFYDFWGKKRDSPIYTTIVMEAANCGSLADFSIDYHYKEAGGKQIWKADQFPEALVWTFSLHICSALVWLRTGRITHGGASPVKELSIKNRHVPILHNDLKANNILVHREAEGEYRFILADFGLACFVLEQGQEGRHGTPSYIAPEYPYLRPSSDVWSLGAVIHYVCTRQQPRLWGVVLNDANRDVRVATDNKVCRRKSAIFDQQPVRILALWKDTRMRGFNYRIPQQDKEMSGVYSEVLTSMLYRMLGRVDAEEELGQRPEAEAMYALLDKAYRAILVRLKEQRRKDKKPPQNLPPDVAEFAAAANDLPGYGELVVKQEMWHDSLFRREYRARVTKMRRILGNKFKRSKYWPAPKNF